MAVTSMPLFALLALGIFLAATDGYLDVAGGKDTTCGITDDGKMECWGTNSVWAPLEFLSGEATGDAKPGADIVVATASNGFMSICMGWEYSCGLTVPGTIECVGRIPRDDEWAPFVRSAKAGIFLDFACGHKHTCGVQDWGDIECFGLNDKRYNFAVGPFNEGDPNIPSGAIEQCPDVWVVRPTGAWTDVEVVGTGGPKFIRVGAGLDATCGVVNTGVIECWGHNNAVYKNAPLFKYASEGVFIDVCMSSSQPWACGVTAFDSGGSLKHRVECWGQNFPEWNQAPAIWDAPSNMNITKVGCGDFHSCVVRGDGAIECRGKDTVLQAPPRGQEKLDYIPYLGQDSATFARAGIAVVFGWGLLVLEI